MDIVTINTQKKKKYKKQKNCTQKSSVILVLYWALVTWRVGERWASANALGLYQLTGSSG